MKELTRKYLFLPLIVLFCGVYQVSPHKAGNDTARLSVHTAHSVTRHYHYFGKGQHNSSEKPVYEIVEQAPNSFQKDLAGDSSFAWLAFKNHSNSFLNLLSERLSLHKPALITHFSEAIYLVIRILRL